jgi:hypothetical protein
MGTPLGGVRGEVVSDRFHIDEIAVNQELVTILMRMAIGACPISLASKRARSMMQAPQAGQPSAPVLISGVAAAFVFGALRERLNTAFR